MSDTDPDLSAESVAAKWREWIDDNAHYCPHCPVEEQEAVIIVSELESFLGTLIDGPDAVTQDRWAAESEFLAPEHSDGGGGA